MNLHVKKNCQYMLHETFKLEIPDTFLTECRLYPGKERNVYKMRYHLRKLKWKWVGPMAGMKDDAGPLDWSSYYAVWYGQQVTGYERYEDSWSDEEWNWILS